MSEGGSAIVVVSGLPRSGTSMMMTMLNAGGLEVLTDREREADRDNPRGYYELERVKRLPDGDTEWLDGAEGKAVKVVSALLEWLPPEREYRVLFMDRSLDEILASQRRMLENRIGGHDGADDARLKETYEQHLRDVEDRLRKQERMQVHHVSHRRLIEDTHRELAPLPGFIGRPLDLGAMARVVDPDLYRQRVESG